MADETAWLIEKADGEPEGPRYLMGIRQGYGCMWSTDNAVAIRFARKQDAERLAMDIQTPTRAVEHMWCDARRDIMDSGGRRDIFQNPRADNRGLGEKLGRK